MRGFTDVEFNTPRTHYWLFFLLLAPVSLLQPFRPFHGSETTAPELALPASEPFADSAPSAWSASQPLAPASQLLCSAAANPGGVWVVGGFPRLPTSTSTGRTGFFETGLDRSYCFLEVAWGCIARPSYSSGYPHFRWLPH